MYISHVPPSYPHPSLSCGVTYEESTIVLSTKIRFLSLNSVLLRIRDIKPFYETSSRNCLPLLFVHLSEKLKYIQVNMSSGKGKPA
jgi:hypothetical protein